MFEQETDPKHSRLYIGKVSEKKKKKSVRVDQPKAVQNSCLNLEENKTSNMLGPNGTPTPSDHLQVLSEKPEIPCNFAQKPKMVFHHLESARQKGNEYFYFQYSPLGRIQLYLSTL